MCINKAGVSELPDVLYCAPLLSKHFDTYIDIKPAQERRTLHVLVGFYRLDFFHMAPVSIMRTQKNGLQRCFAAMIPPALQSAALVPDKLSCRVAI